LTLFAAVTIVLGLVFGFQGYNDHFRLYNPGLHEKLSAKLNPHIGPKLPGCSAIAR
jgi:hypothetical protein